MNTLPTPTRLQPKASGFAVASLVLGILWIGGIGSILAVIFGGIAMSQTSASKPNRPGGRGMAIAGLVLGIIGIVLMASVYGNTGSGSSY